jgi:KipI family sensor histidine kinase inhibitor
LAADPGTRRAPAFPGLVVQSYGDSAVLLTATSADRVERWRLVHRVADVVATMGTRASLSAIATFDTVLVEFDCTENSHDGVVAQLRLAMKANEPSRREPASVFSVPVVYGHEYGPDLDDVAAELELPASAVVSGHADRAHVVRCVVSPPGAPMTDLPSFDRPIRRMRAPRPNVPAGSVAVSGRQAMIYATASPGGWRLIGRTPARLFDATGQPPVPYRPGDTLRFVPIRPDEWGTYLARPIEQIDA